MPDQKITDLTALTGANAATGDLVEVVDISDSTMAASGTNKKMTLANLAAAVAKEGVVATDAVFDAKGDLVAGTGANAAAKVTVGANNTVLVADSGQSTGVNWAPAAFDMQSIPFGRTGAYYTVAGGRGGATTTQTQGDGVVRYSPLIIGALSITFDRIGAEVTTAAAGATFRLGVYNVSSTGGVGTLVFDAGTIDASGTGVKEITISQTLTRGVYWAAIANQGGATAGCRVYASSLRCAWHGFSSAANSSANNVGAIFPLSTGVTGAFASNPTISYDGDGAPIVFFRAA